MAALQYVDQRDYAAILFRRTHADLALEGALMDRAADWLGGTDAKWHGQDKRWSFPSGATMTFGYMDAEKDKFRYKSAEFQFCGFDEATQFSESQYRFMFSRLRRQKGQIIPLRMRGASNPGDVGHDWVKSRFILFPERGRIFIPAKIIDNPYLDQAEYIKSLDELDPVTRAQMLEGDWDAYEGGMFQRDWFPAMPEVPIVADRVRYWDKAGTKDDGAYSVGLLMAATKEGLYFVEDVVRGQWSSFQRNSIMLQTAQMDEQKYHRKVTTWIEQEPGSGGKESAEYSVKLLAGFDVKTERATGEKADRARPYASQCGAGNVRLKLAPWNKSYIDEMVLFPNGQYKDQADSSSGAFNKLVLQRKLTAWVL